MASHNPSVPLSDTHDQRIEALKVDMESIIKNIKWPSSSKLSAEEFVKGVKTSPTVPKDLSGLSQELHNAYNAYVKVIEDVDTRIKDAASKSAMWKLLDPLTQVLPKRTSRCTLVFQTCQADILTAAKALKK
ncbi:hypothetical protein FRB90_000595 [Tulasnella sp. 427]|nr:hypothetical protein FRB90_000595 [Tulasnella sp. 427]